MPFIFVGIFIHENLKKACRCSNLHNSKIKMGKLFGLCFEDITKAQ